MKDNRKYSLTAKERKAKRLAAQNKDRAKTPEPVTQPSGDAQTEAERGFAASQKKTRRSAIIVGTVVCCAVVLILAGILVPLIAYIVNPYRNYDHVIARFDLSNGMKLEYVIEENEYDIAATNFIFLAENGYFDNTVFFDAGNADAGTDGWLRFGGYEAQPSVSLGSASDYGSTKHHAQNGTFCEKFGAIPNSKFKKVTDKFGYKLNSDTKGTGARLNDIGVLAYMYNNSSTEFQFSYKEQPSNHVTIIESSGKTYQDTYNPTMVGYALNDETVENIKAIAATAKVNTAISYGVQWNPPSPDIMIEKVKVYNLDNAKWRDFDFISYMDDHNYLRGWTGRA